VSSSAGTDGLISGERDEDDRNLLAGEAQFPLEIGPDMPGMAMSRIRHLVWQTQSDARNSSADENAWTAKAELPQQVGQRLAHGLVVIDNRHE
jgi:hypothetical protein